MRKHIRVAAIALIWLFHISGIIGIVLGYETWFIPKTPLTLLISFILLILLYPMGSMIKYASVLLFFAIGFFVEWIGVTYGFLFGEYYYGNNLGTKIGGVPLMMGITWSMLVLTSGAMVSKLAIPPAFKSIIGAALMVFLDFFIEPSAPTFDFWYWAIGHPPLINYISWFIISFVMHLIYHRYIKGGNLDISKHLYLAQLMFFAFFYVY